MGSFGGVELDGLVLSGERLTLRPWQPGDAPVVQSTLQDPRMHEYLALPRPYRSADAVEFVTRLGHEGRAEGTGLGCAVVRTDTGEFVGAAALRLPAGLRADADIGYWIAPRAQGHGYAAEATQVLARWGFGLGLPRIELHCEVRNVASARSALGAGFRFEGVRRGYVPSPGGARDLASFGRTAEDTGDPVPPAFAQLARDGLSDGVLRLRAVRPDDAAALAETDDEVAVAHGFTGEPQPFDEVRRAADRAGLDWLVGAAAPFALVDVAGGRVAGSLRLRLAGPPAVGGIGYAVHPAFRGRGYAARALRLLVPWAFGAGGFARLELGAKTGNPASQRAALAAGFAPDGVRAGRLRNPDGSFSDEVRFALVNPAVERRG